MKESTKLQIAAGMASKINKGTFDETYRPKFDKLRKELDEEDNKLIDMILMGTLPLKDVHEGAL